MNGASSSTSGPCCRPYRTVPSKPASILLSGIPSIIDRSVSFGLKITARSSRTAARDAPQRAVLLPDQEAAPADRSVQGEPAHGPARGVPFARPVGALHGMGTQARL